MSLLDKISFIKSFLPNLIEVLKIIVKCLQVVVESDSNAIS